VDYVGLLKVQTPADLDLDSDSAQLSDMIHTLLRVGPVGRQGEDDDRNIVCSGQFLGPVA